MGAWRLLGRLAVVACLLASWLPAFVVPHAHAARIAEIVAVEAQHHDHGCPAAATGAHQHCLGNQLHHCCALPVVIALPASTLEQLGRPFQADAAVSRPIPPPLRPPAIAFA